MTVVTDLLSFAGLLFSTNVLSRQIERDSFIQQAL